MERKLTVKTTVRQLFFFTSHWFKNLNTETVSNENLFTGTDMTEQNVTFQPNRRINPKDPKKWQYRKRAGKKSFRDNTID